MTSARSHNCSALCLSLGLAALAAACQGAATPQGSATGQGSATTAQGPASDARIAPADARQLVAQGATLLDVRSQGEWAEGHLEGAVLVPIHELEARMAEIDRNKPVVVYCAAGGRSSAATDALRKAGYDARDLGGMKRWYE